MNVGWWFSSIFFKYFWTLFWDSVMSLGNCLIFLRLDLKLCYAGTYPLAWTYLGPTTKEIAFWELYLMPCVLEVLPTLTGVNMSHYRSSVHLGIGNYSFHSFPVFPSQASCGLLTCIWGALLGLRFEWNFLKLSSFRYIMLSINAFSVALYILYSALQILDSLSSINSQFCLWYFMRPTVFLWVHFSLFCGLETLISK